MIQIHESETNLKLLHCMLRLLRKLERNNLHSARDDSKVPKSVWLFNCRRKKMPLPVLTVKLPNYRSWLIVVRISIITYYNVISTKVAKTPKTIHRFWKPKRFAVKLYMSYNTVRKSFGVINLLKQLQNRIFIVV